MYSKTVAVSSYPPLQYTAAEGGSFLVGEQHLNRLGRFCACRVRLPGGWIRPVLPMREVRSQITVGLSVCSFPEVSLLSTFDPSRSRIRLRGSRPCRHAVLRVGHAVERYRRLSEGRQLGNLNVQGALIIRSAMSDRDFAIRECSSIEDFSNVSISSEVCGTTRTSDNADPALHDSKACSAHYCAFESSGGWWDSFTRCALIDGGLYIPHLRRSLKTCGIRTSASE